MLSVCGVECLVRLYCINKTILLQIKTTFIMEMSHKTHQPWFFHRNTIGNRETGVENASVKEKAILSAYPILPLVFWWMVILFTISIVKIFKSILWTALTWTRMESVWVGNFIKIGCKQYLEDQRADSNICQNCMLLQFMIVIKWLSRKYF